MNKAEKYLNERINLMSNERVTLLTKIDETDFEIKEIENKIRDLRNCIDDTFEIFSPRTKKNDFIKNEIECLEKEVDDLSALRDEYRKKAERVLEDIDVIEDALRENTDEDSEDTLDNHDAFELVSDDGGVIEKKILQSVSNLINRCEICERAVEIDKSRVKLEIKVMRNELSELYNNIKIITGDLEKTTDSNVEPVKKLHVKKLSKDNFKKEKQLDNIID